MGDQDAREMFDRCVHEYMLRNGMHTTAETFVREAGFQPFNDTETNGSPPEGRLREWWSIFYDVYTSRFPNTSQPPLLQNAQPGSSVPDFNYMLQKMRDRTLTSTTTPAAAERSGDAPTCSKRRTKKKNHVPSRLGRMDYSSK